MSDSEGYTSDENARLLPPYSPSPPSLSPPPPYSLVNLAAPAVIVQRKIPWDFYILNALQCIGIPMLIWGLITVNVADPEQLEFLTPFLLPMMIIGGTIGPLACMCTCRIRKGPLGFSLEDLEVGEGARMFVARYRGKAPVLTMRIECYHTERKTITSTDTDGKRTTSYQTVDVVTHEAEKEFKYDSVEDFSCDLSRPFKAWLVALEQRTVIDFADEYTKRCWDEEEAAFIAAHKNRDHMFRYSATRVVPGVKDLKVCLFDPTPKPWWLSPGYYNLSFLLFMQFAYVLYVRHISVHVVCTFHKTVRRNQPSE